MKYNEKEALFEANGQFVIKEVPFLFFYVYKLTFFTSGIETNKHVIL